MYLFSCCSSLCVLLCLSFKLSRLQPQHIHNVVRRALALLCMVYIFIYLWSFLPTAADDPTPHCPLLALVLMCGVKCAGGEDRGRHRVLQRGVHTGHKGLPAAAGQQDGAAGTAADAVHAGDPPAAGDPPGPPQLLYAPRPRPPRCPWLFHGPLSCPHGHSWRQSSGLAHAPVPGPAGVLLHFLLSKVSVDRLWPCEDSREAKQMYETCEYGSLVDLF